MISLRCAPPGEPVTTVSLDVDAASELRALAQNALAQRAFLLADAEVLALHPCAPRWPTLALHGGESAKTFAALETVLRRMAADAFGRDSILVALGGGSIGDLGGLAASLYLRGIAFAQVPTTLLSMLDSSVGGKTAINLPEGKNLVGTFHPATLVLIDISFLATLPNPDYLSGLGEAVKIAIGLDASLLSLLECHEPVLRRDHAVLTSILELALAAKIRIVESDPREQGPRRLLNLGHTLGHALEAHSGYRIPHGIAVARGIHFALDVAAARNLIDEASLARCRSLLEIYGFMRTPIPDRAALMSYLQRDKKARGGAIRMALPCGAGKSVVTSVDVVEVERMLV